MATQSSTLAWRIPWTEEPGGLQSMDCKESDTTKRLSMAQHINKGTYEIMLGNVQSRASLVAQMVMNLPSNGNAGLIPGSGKSPGEGNGNPL